MGRPQALSRVRTSLLPQRLSVRGSLRRGSSDLPCLPPPVSRIPSLASELTSAGRGWDSGQQQPCLPINSCPLHCCRRDGCAFLLPLTCPTTYVTEQAGVPGMMESFANSRKEAPCYTATASSHSIACACGMSGPLAVTPPSSVSAGASTDSTPTRMQWVGDAAKGTFKKAFVGQKGDH